MLSGVTLETSYYAENYARLEVERSNYAGLKWHFHPNPPLRPVHINKHSLSVEGPV